MKKQQLLWDLLTEALELGTNPSIYSWYKPGTNPNGTDNHDKGNVTIALSSNMTNVQCGLAPKKATPILIRKVDQNGNPVGGAVFKISKNNVFVENVTTDANGYAYSTPFQSAMYKVQEIQAPLDYVLDSTEYTINVDQNNKDPEYLDCVNQRAIGAVEVTKVDAQGNPLAGAVF